MKIFFFRNGRRVHRFILCQYYMMFSLFLYPPPIFRLCIALFVVAEMLLLLDYGWFALFFHLFDMTMGGTVTFVLVCQVCLPSRIKHEVSEETVLRIRNNSQICAIHHYGQNTQFKLDDLRKWIETSTKMYKKKLKEAKILKNVYGSYICGDKINYHKVSRDANVLILKEFYPKTKNMYYLKSV